MTQTLEAVFEDGVLRPLEAVSLAEKQHVLVTISEMPEAVTAMERKAEFLWLEQNAGEFRGQWVALDGSRLVSHGLSAKDVLLEARAKGVARPLMHQIPDEPAMPSVGWL